MTEFPSPGRGFRDWGNLESLRAEEHVALSMLESGSWEISGGFLVEDLLDLILAIFVEILKGLKLDVLVKLLEDLWPGEDEFGFE